MTQTATRIVNEDDLHISTWFERDRAHVHLFLGDDFDTIIEWWDNDVSGAVEDGFLNPKDWLGSAIAYAVDLGIITLA